MSTTTTVRIGQVWADPPTGDLALVFATQPDGACLRYVTGSTAGHTIYRSFTTLAGGQWRLSSENARLRCVSPDAALAAARFLTGRGLRDVLVDGDLVSAPLTVMSVMQFADDAFNNGWAHDEDCARMIGDLG